MYDSRSCRRASLAVPPLLAAAAAERRPSFFSCALRGASGRARALAARGNDMPCARSPGRRGPDNNARRVHTAARLQAGYGAVGGREAARELLLQLLARAGAW